MHPPTLLRPSEVPHELKCPICISVPLTPKILPCEHVFCAECIERAIEAQSACPTCRRECQRDKIIDLPRDSLGYRIWTGIQVECPHCTNSKSGQWKGSIVDFERHYENCRKGRKHQRKQGHHMIRKEVELTQRLVEGLHKHRCIVEAKVEGLINLQRLVRDTNCHGEKNKRQPSTTVSRSILLEPEGQYDGQRQVHHSKAKHKCNKNGNEHANNNKSGFNPKQIFRGKKYSFGINDAGKLTQLIATHLNCKPNYINGNKLYQCVHHCYQDLVKTDTHFTTASYYCSPEEDCTSTVPAPSSTSTSTSPTTNLGISEYKKGDICLYKSTIQVTVEKVHFNDDLLPYYDVRTNREGGIINTVNGNLLKGTMTIAGSTSSPYEMDMYILLTICLASNWFTKKQRNNVLNWVQEHNW